MFGGTAGYCTCGSFYVQTASIQMDLAIVLDGMLKSVGRCVPPLFDPYPLRYALPEI